MAVLDDPSVVSTLESFVRGAVRLDPHVADIPGLSKILREVIKESGSPTALLSFLRQLADRQDGSRTILGGGPEFSPTGTLRTEGQILVIGEAQLMHATPRGYAVGEQGALMVLLIPLAGPCEVLQLVNDRQVTTQRTKAAESPARTTLRALQVLALHARTILELLAYRANGGNPYDRYMSGIHTLLTDGQHKAGIGGVAEAMRLRIPHLLPWHEVDAKTEQEALEVQLAWQWLLIAGATVGLNPAQLFNLANALMEEEPIA